MNIRNTKTASLNLSAGVNTLQIDLGANSVNIIQSISVTFSSYPLADVTAWNIQTFDGTNNNLVYSSAGVVGQAFTQIKREQSIISSSRYLLLNVTATVGTGESVSVAVSYFQISSLNPISGNFLFAAGTTAAGTTSILTGPGESTYVIKSVWITISDAAAQNVYLTLNQGSVNSPVCASTAISGVAGNISSTAFASIADINLSILPGNSLVLHQGGTNNLDYYVSYTWDVLDIT